MADTKEHPILFNSDIVRAILAGRKTQTRKVIKPQPKKVFYTPDRPDWGWHTHQKGGTRLFCPYGVVGDKLWVRETFVIESTREYHSYLNIQEPTDKPFKRIDDEDGEYFHIPHYRATEPEPHITDGGEDGFDDTTEWRPSIFMPKWACRLWLEITNIRVERVQDISEEDAIAEGVMRLTTYRTETPMIDMFRHLWNILNAKRGFEWDANPLVFVIEFRRDNGCYKNKLD